MSGFFFSVWVAVAISVSTSSRNAAVELELLAAHLSHGLGGESELLLNVLERRRGAERVHPHHGPVLADESLPAERRCLLDRHPRLDRRRQHLLAVVLRLLVEQMPRGHADDADLVALRCQVLVRVYAQCDLGAGPDQ